MDDREVISNDRGRGGGSRLRIEILLLAASAVLALMAAPALWGEVYILDDLSNFHLPFRLFYARCLSEGHAFDWCPRVFCGFDLQGEGQLGMYHPLHLLLYGALPFGAAFNLELLLNYPAAMLGMFLFLRRRRLPTDAALAGGFVFALAGFNLFHYMHLNAVAVVAHIPWALLAIDRLLRAEEPRTRARAGAGLALVTGSQLLLGYPQYVLFSLVIETAYVVAVGIERRGRLLRLPSLATAMLLGLALGAVQLLPSREALALSQRAELPRVVMAMFSLPPKNLMLWLVPYLSTTRVHAPAEPFYPGDEPSPAMSLFDPRVWEYGTYNGAAIPVLTLWILLRFRRLGSGRTLAAWALGLAAIGLLLALGDHFSSLFGLTRRVPFLKIYRVPSRWILLVHLATAVLAAVALADLASIRRRGEQIPWRRLWPLALPPIGSVAIVSATLAGAGSAEWPGPTLGSHAALAWSVGLVTAVSVVVVAAARSQRLALVGLVGLMAVDVGSYGATYLAGGLKVPLTELAADHRLSGLPTETRLRLEKPFTLRNLWMFSGLGQVDGYVGLTPHRALDYSRPEALRVASAGWRLGEGGGPVADTLPRARLVAEARVSDSPAVDLPEIDPASVVLVDREVTLVPGPPGSVTISQDDPGSVRMIAESPTAQFLVFSERFHPGWSVRVAGQPAEVVRSYGDFLGVVVPAGRHLVEFRYAPRSLLIGRIVSVAALILVIAWPVSVAIRAHHQRRARNSSATALNRPAWLNRPHLFRNAPASGAEGRRSPSRRG